MKIKFLLLFIFIVLVNDGYVFSQSCGKIKVYYFKKHRLKLKWISICDKSVKVWVLKSPNTCIQCFETLDSYFKKHQIDYSIIIAAENKKHVFLNDLNLVRKKTPNCSNYYFLKSVQPTSTEDLLMLNLKNYPLFTQYHVSKTPAIIICQKDTVRYLSYSDIFDTVGQITLNIKKEGLGNN